jgi:glycosyltransferase involved in cell wall biosynthesis
MILKKFNLKKTLHIDASRLKSGGGIIHLIKILENIKYSIFDKIIVYTYKNSEFEKFKSQKIIIKTHSFINKNIIYQFFWQRYLLKKQISSDHLLFTIDSTSFCKFKNNVVLNQDIIGFQEGSLRYFSLKNKFESYLKYFVAKYAIKNSAANIFTTKYALDEVQKKTGILKKTIVIPHGIDDQFLTKKINYNISRSILKIIYVSTIFDYKNHKYLISALNNLPTKRKLDVYFVGDGDIKLINELKNKTINNKGNQFHFLGFLERKKVYSLTKNSDIAVFMSSVECFGITLLEYMRIGMPIVCSSESSLPETLQNSGLLINPFNENSIIKAITDLELNQDLREEFGKKAYTNSLKYSWVKTAKETYYFLNKIYEETLK